MQKVARHAHFGNTPKVLTSDMKDFTAAYMPKPTPHTRILTKMTVFKMKRPVQPMNL